MLRKCIKIIAAGLLAFLVLSIFSGFYYNLPIHKKSDTYATDYVWEPNRFQARGTEGFSYGWTDAKGFNNKEVVDDISVLMMGSSHMEALNVQTEESATSLLNDLFSENKVDMRAYNIGISGHPLARCINNLENAVKEFAPSDYVVIETATPKFTKQEMQEVTYSLGRHLLKAICGTYFALNISK